MIENYFLDKFGIIHQKNINPIKYNENYLAGFKTIPSYAINCHLLSYLRIGLAIGAGAIREQEKILDIGYGNGAFLDAAFLCGIETAGYDISGHKINKVHKIIESLPEVLSNKYNLVTFFDSLEHIPDLDFLGSLKTNYICISVPLCHWDTKGDKWFMEWKHRKVNEHLHHFGENSLVKFMKSIKYKPILINNAEDSIRGKLSDGSDNILTAIFERQDRR